MKRLSDPVLAILSCPYCGRELTVDLEGACCRGCGERFALSANDQLDLRLTKNKACTVEYEVGVPLQPPPQVTFSRFDANPAPEVDFTPVAPSGHLSRTMMSYIPKARQPGELMLNIGCGVDPAPRLASEHAGFEYLGVDIDYPLADMVCDAHALPFKAESFGFLLSIAVLEHIQFPSVMAREAHRVLKPGGRFIGTVAFLEPYHSRSYYHHTHLGVLNTLQSAGFEVEVIAPSAEWDGLAAQAHMMLFPKMGGRWSRALVAPLRLLHKAWWKLGARITRHPEVCEKNRLLYGTGSFSFIAHK